ncbi:PREDICTED: lysosome-associated membrane glycoprotein 1 [Nanorana parkeri]|uniref:lysosome-associated membrane glycoprotein 1 n=1 Tax=Nanorana parkeri TaxID=125878 RepID=UPI0008540144|nr:PREDICTED: lysosome-associated membrane glycoprotein 1 [Nanorana parkeri]
MFVWETAKFELPAASSVGSKSTCGDEKEAALLVIVFGIHSLSINFTKSVTEYRVDELVFTYNLSDTLIFPKASENGTKEVSTKNSAISAKTNTVYICSNPHLLRLGNVNLTFHGVILEAYLSNGTYRPSDAASGRFDRGEAINITGAGGTAPSTSAATPGTKEVSTKNSAISAKTNTVYICSNPHLLRLGNVNLTFHGVILEAYLSNGTYSKNESHCSEDISPTSSPTHSPTPSPTTVPVNPKPDVGDYRVNGSSGEACLLAKMGLHLNFTRGKVPFYELNIDPKNISVAGLCGNTSSTLILFTDQVYLLFTFVLNTTSSTFFLSHVHVNATLPDAKDPKFVEDNSSLSYLQTAAHKSYKCTAKETLLITGNFSIDTYSLQIQAFNIDGNKFGPAVECAADQNGMLVPIVVGAALAGLVLIVLIAYLIGRKRSHAGYQTI